jgi:hypothetical protein
MPQVAEYKIGNTTIRIFDDACAGKSQAEVDAILNRVGQLAVRAFAKPVKPSRHRSSSTPLADNSALDDSISASRVDISSAQSTERR